MAEVERVDGIEEVWKWLSFIETEEEVVGIDVEDEDDEIKFRVSLMMAGKVFINKFFSV